MVNPKGFRIRGNSVMPKNQMAAIVIGMRRREFCELNFGVETAISLAGSLVSASQHGISSYISVTASAHGKVGSVPPMRTLASTCTALILANQDG